jgi:hypothetical protein
MPLPFVQLLGAYQLPLTSEVIEEAMATWYGGSRAGFSGEEEKEAQQRVREELESTVLFDLVLRDTDERFAMEDFGQPDSDQAAWDERFLDHTTGATIGRTHNPPPAASFRLLFYLHFVDAAKPLNTSYGPVAIPRISPMPPELWRTAPYQAVD